MKKIALLLLLCICFSLLSACGKEEINLAQTDEPIEEIDLYGFNLIYDHAPDMGIPEGSPFGYLKDNEFADLAMARIKKLEAELNFTMELTYSTTGTMKNNISRAVSAGLLYADALDVEDGIIKDMALGGFLMPYSEISDTINIYDFDKWGAPNILECVMSESELYGIRANYWPNRYPSFGAPIIFNSKLTADGGHADLREYLEQKVWDRELMLQVIKDCTVIENGETKIHGMAVDTSYIFMLCLSSNSNNFFKKEGDAYVNNTSDPKTIAAMTWVVDMLKDNSECFVNGGVYVNRETFLNPFLEGKAATFMHMTWALFSVIGMQVESWGLMPYPTGLEAEYGDWSSYYAGNRNYVGIAVNTDDPEAVGIVIDKLYEPFEEYDTFEKIREHYDRQYFHDTRDGDLYFELSNNCRYNYWHDGGYMISSAIATGFKSKTPAQVVDSMSNKMQTMIDKYVAGNQPLYEELMEEYLKQK